MDYPHRVRRANICKSLLAFPPASPHRSTNDDEVVSSDDNVTAIAYEHCITVLEEWSSCSPLKVKTQLHIRAVVFQWAIILTESKCPEYRGISRTTTNSAVKTSMATRVVKELIWIDRYIMHLVWIPFHAATEMQSLPIPAKPLCGRFP